MVNTIIFTMIIIFLLWNSESWLHLRTGICWAGFPWCVYSTSWGLVRHFQEALLNPSGHIFCPEVKMGTMMLGPERFDTAHSAWTTHTLRTSFVFLMTLPKNSSYLDLEHLIDKTFYDLSSVDSDGSFHNVRRLYNFVHMFAFFFCTDYLVVEKTREFPSLVFILPFNWTKDCLLPTPQVISTPWYCDSVRQHLCKSSWT